MTTTALAPEPSAQIRESLRQLPRFTYIELRKLVDTRSAKILFLSLGFLGLATLIPMVKVLEPGEALTLGQVFGTVTQFLNVAMAIIGVMGMTGDWTHNVTTSYFPLVKNRGIIFGSKIIATFLAAVLLLGFNLLLSIASLAVIRGTTDANTASTMETSDLRGAVATTIASTLFAVGIASIARRLILSLILVGVLTVGVTFVVTLVDDENLQFALSTFGLLFALADDSSGESFAPPAWTYICSTVLWYVCPLIIGWLIMRKAEA
ncbi:MAG: hypothetical protein ACRC0L_10085 [Angustibacter sp.]